MSQQRDDGARRRRQIALILGVVFLGMGVAILSAALGNERVQALHMGNIIQLVCSGMILGMALALLVIGIVGGFMLPPRASRNEPPPSQAADRQAVR